MTTAATTSSAATTVGSNRNRAALVRIQRLAQAAGSALGAIGSRWNDFVDAGQLGPSADTVTSRYTGGRI